MCNSEGIIIFLILFNRIMAIIQIVAPILVLLMLSILFFRMVYNPEDKKLKKNVKNMFFALIVVFFIPLLVKTTIYITTSNSSCLEEEEILLINDNYSIFKGNTYIKIDDGRETRSIISDPRDYEKGDEKKEEKNGVSPANDGTAISNGNAVYFLGTTGSDSFIIQDDNHFGVIDTGYYSNYIIKQLKRINAKELDFIMITHSHPDHVGGFSNLIDKYPTKALFIKTDGTKYSVHKNIYKRIINKAKKKGTYVCDVKKSECQSFSLGNINFRIYNTGFFKSSLVSSNDYTRFDNINSIVTVATINNKKVYFSADIGNYFGYNQESIIARQIGDVDVYKIAHHGYVSFNNNQDAINVLKPEYAVVTNTRGNASEAVRRVKASNSNFKKVYYTSNGTVAMTISSDGKIKFYQ